MSGRPAGHLRYGSLYKGLLYDWTPRHADSAFCNNKCMWVEQVYKKLEGTVIDAASLRAVMTDTRKGFKMHLERMTITGNHTGRQFLRWHMSL